MKFIKIIFTALILLSIMLPAQDYEKTANQIKKDLVGHQMGAREKGWKFQSEEQIKTLEIDSVSRMENEQIYFLSMMLNDKRVPDSYQAQAQVVYQKSNGKWDLKSVGLISLKEMKPEE